MTSQAATLKNIAPALISRPKGSLPSDTGTNPQGVGLKHCNAISLHSGKQVEVKVKLEAEGSNQVSCDEPNLNVPLGNKCQPQPKIPFPQRLKKHIDPYFQNFLKLLESCIIIFLLMKT